ncbi:MAG TPA: EamA family transporter RarD [Caulobacteraceae bacterium]|nr:EamA family transporter RarD [Caulobacteraceae bacterium]
MSAATGEAKAGVIAGTVCYVVWGFVPLFFQAIADFGAGPWEILAHRIAWGSLAAWVLVLFAKQSSQVAKIFRSPKTLGLLAISAALIAVNWVIYIWAVTNQKTLDASLGYYLVPLINVGAGALLFHERIGLAAKIAIGVAAVGIVLQGVALGHVPLASLVLAIMWGGYGIIRKRVNADAQAGLLVECLVLAIPAFGYIGWLEASGHGHMLSNPTSGLLLLAAGPVTAAPLALFAWAARRTPLSTMGFLQFIAPTLSFVIGAEEGESLTPLRLASFAFIWAGVAIFAWAAWQKTRRLPAPLAGRAAAG